MLGAAWLSLSVKLYRLLLVLYPAAHRRAYGAPMAQLFRDACRDTLREKGTRGLAVLWIRMLGDAIASAAVERLSACKNGGVVLMTELLQNRRRYAGWIVAGSPLVLAALLSALNPRFMGLMVLPHPDLQPLGWALTLGVLVLTALALFSQHAGAVLAVRAPQRAAATRALFAGSIVFLTLPALCLVFFGPAFLQLLGAGVL
ncbi:MAG: hypothetical protein JXA09_08230 [Anaerolineae bacterium]|nr:hypothetical protein [Anaerolineae bacterium]